MVKQMEAEVYKMSRKRLLCEAEGKAFWVKGKACTEVTRLQTAQCLETLENKVSVGKSSTPVKALSE